MILSRYYHLFIITILALATGFADEVQERLHIDGSRTPASIPEKQIKLDLEKVAQVKPLDQGIDQQDMNLMVPTDMAATDNQTVIQNKIMDRNVRNFIQGKYTRNNRYVRAAQQVQKALQPKVTFGDPSKGETQHSINMEYMAFQRQAKVKYEGYLLSDVTYDAAASEVEVAVREDLTPNTQVSVEHQTQADLSWLKLNWSW